MKYIRTKDGRIIDLSKMFIPYQIIENYIDFNSQGRFEIIKQADTIEELCDEFVLLIKPDDGKKWGLLMLYDDIKNLKKYPENGYYGAIWTDEGLQFVARMNSKGELELI